MLARAADDGRARRALSQYFAAIASLDPGKIADCFAEDGEIEDPVGTPIHRGRRAISEYWAHGLCAVAAAVEIDVVAALPAGDSIAAHWRMAARATSGHTADAEGIDVLRVDDSGLIERAEGYWDLPGFRADLGVGSRSPSA